MSVIQLISNSLQRSLQMLQHTLADFSDADFFVRPATGANHAAWQLGHLIASETRMVGRANPDAPAKLPAGFAEKFSKETARVDDPEQFPTKAQILEQLAMTRAASVAWCESLTPELLDHPTPTGSPPMIPTFGSVLLLIPSHTAMHMGQLQVLRRKLGKPILF